MSMSVTPPNYAYQSVGGAMVKMTVELEIVLTKQTVEVKQVSDPHILPYNIYYKKNCNHPQKSATQTNSVVTMDIVPQVATLVMAIMTVRMDLMSAVVLK